MSANSPAKKVIASTPKTPRAIVVRYELSEDDKRQLRKAARHFGYRGLRQLLLARALTDLGSDFL